MKTLSCGLLCGCLLAGHPLLAAQFVIDGDRTIGASDASYDTGDLLIRAGTLTIHGEHSFGSVTIVSNAQVSLDGTRVAAAAVALHGAGRLTLAGGLVLDVQTVIDVADTARIDCLAANVGNLVDGQWRGVGVTIQAAHLAIAPDARIVADRVGYLGSPYWSSPGRGPGGGKGGGDWNHGAGAGHGAVGASPPSTPKVAGGAAYGSAFWPTAPGSGGGGGSEPWDHGGAGGGAVHLIVSGTFALHGGVSANAESGTGSWGSGSGGSVLVEADAFSGDGFIEARGADSGPEGGGAGAGGRVAVHSRLSTFAGHSRCSVQGGLGAEEGTLAFVDHSVPGYGLELHQRFAIEDAGSLDVGRLRLFAGGRLVLGTSAQFTSATDVDVAAGAQIDLGGAASFTVVDRLSLLGSNAVIHAATVNRDGQIDGQWKGTGVVLRARSVFIAPEASIVADGVGYLGSPYWSHPGRGPGGGQGGGDWNHGAGAGHGAVGAAPPSTPKVAGGAAYGSALWPTAPGSGGGGGSPSWAYGGAGGGAIHLVVGETFELRGRVTANGEIGTGSWGSGSGGSILVDAGTFVGDGLLEARGGDGGPDGGGAGAGGRIAIHFRQGAFTTPYRCSVDGGGGAEAGTLIFVDHSTPQWALQVYHRFALTDGVQMDWGRLHVFPGGRLLVDSGVRVGLSTDLDVEPGGEVRLGGGAWLGVTNALRLLGTNSIILASTANRSAPIDGEWRGAGVGVQAGEIRVAAGARIAADAEGYLGATWYAHAGGGPGGGAGGGAQSIGGGAGHGGQGQSVPGSSIRGGVSYGSAALPFEPGSGGGGGSADGSRGGDGGGAIHLIADRELRIDGIVSADGSDGVGSAGGGSGGSILIQAGTIVGEGWIRALGGSGSGGAGGGAGGRIALHYWNQRFFPPNHCLVSVGTGGIGGENGTVHFGPPGSEPIGFAVTPALLHGRQTVAWAAMSVSPVGATTEVTATGAGFGAVLEEQPGDRGSFVWDTSLWPDGPYELRLRVRAANGSIALESAQAIALNNSAMWHSGTLAQAETWKRGEVHLVEGDFIVPAGAPLKIEPGSVVKFLPNARFVTAAGASVDAQGTSDLPVVFTSVADDASGGDANQDGDASVPRPGDWQFRVEGNGVWLANGFTFLRYSRSQHGGLLAGEAIRFAGNTLHEILTDVTVPPGSTLTLEPGAVLKFHDKCGLIVPATARLSALGTREQPIVFTSMKDDTAGVDLGSGSASASATTAAAAGDWRWIQVGGEAELVHCDLRYGGGTASGQWDSTGMFRVLAGGQASLRQSRLSESFFDGLLASGTATLENCVVRGMDRAVAVHPGSTVRVLHCTIDDSRIGVQIHGGSLELWNSIVTGCRDAGVVRDLPSPPPSVHHCDLWNPGAGAGNSAGIDDPVGASGNISAEPRFARGQVDAYRLGFGSPCIDAADGTVATVRDGLDAERYDDPRTANAGTAIPAGAFADMGAREFVETAESDLDLAVEDVAGPGVLVAGTTARVQWTVRNVGSGVVTGGWHDRVLLVPVEAGATAMPLETAVVASREALGPGQGTRVTADVRVPGGTEGRWRWQVRVNCRADIFEGREDGNNVATAAAESRLALPTLAVGGTERHTFAGAGIPAWFRIAANPGQPLEIALDADTLTGRCQLFAAVDRMPTTEDFEVRSLELNSPDARLFVSSGSSSGSIYLLVVPEEIPDGRNSYELRVKPSGFAVESLDLTRGGNAGTVTVRLNGTGLASGLAVELAGPGGEVHRAERTDVLDPTLAEVRFDLRGATPGVYRLRATLGTSVAELADAFEVAHGMGPRIGIRVVMPSVVRAGRPFEFFLEYRNDGDADAVAPLIVLRSLSGHAVFKLPGRDRESADSLSVLGLAENHPTPGVLPPGSRFTLPIQLRVTDSSEARVEAYVFEAGDPDPMDYGALHAGIVPVETHVLWAPAWQEVIRRCGPTVGEFVDALAGTATKAAALGSPVRTERDALEFLIGEAMESVQDARVRGRVLLGSPGVPQARATVYLEPVEPAADPLGVGGVYSTQSWFDGTYAVRDVPPGRYRVVVAGYVPSPVREVVVPEKEAPPVIDVDLHLHGTAAQIVGEVRDQAGGLPVEGATLTARAEGQPLVRVTRSDVSGRFVLGELVPGLYEVSVTVAGRLPGSPHRFRLNPGETRSESFDLPGPGASIAGTVADAGGKPVAGAHVTLGQPGAGSGPAWPGLSRSTDTDAQGRYRFEGLPDGWYRVRAAEAAVGWAAPVWVELAAGDTSIVADLTLDSAKGLAGIVMDSATKQPVANAAVVAAAFSPLERSTRTGPDGTFQFDGPPLGSSRLVAWKEGYLPRLVPVTTDAVGPTVLEVELTPGEFTPLVPPPESGAAASAARGPVPLGPGLHDADRPWTVLFPPEMFQYPPTLYASQWMGPKLKQDQAMFEAAMAAFSRMGRKCSALNTDKVQRDLELMSNSIDDLQDAVEDFVDEIDEADLARLVRAFNQVSGLPTGLYTALSEMLRNLPTLPESAIAQIESLQGLSIETLSALYAGNFELEASLLQFEDQLAALQPFLEDPGLGVEGPRALSTLVDFRYGTLPATRIQLKNLQELDGDFGESYSQMLNATSGFVSGSRMFDEDFPRMLGRSRDCKGGGGAEPGDPPPQSCPPESGSSGASPAGDPGPAAGLACPAKGGGAARVVGSFDPNDKQSTGVGAESFVGPDESILYTIHFENVATATAPAQEVRIVDPLDPNLAWETFEALEVAFNNTVVRVPGGLADFHVAARVASDPNPVDVMVNLDPATGVVRWILRSVDAWTGDAPEDPWAGFLPPNDATHRGEGHVTFRIRPRAFLPTGTWLTNRASIVFDANPEIVTPTVTNRVDALAPESRVRVVDLVNGRLALVWTAEDAAGSGAVTYDVFASVNGGDFAPWLSATAATAGQLVMLPGSRVALYSIATDAAGNRERAPAVPDVEFEYVTAVALVGLNPVRLEWPTEANRVYAVERAMELGDGALWSRIGGPIGGVNGRASFEDKAAPPTGAFYRVRLW